MSGICGIINFDGAPVDQQELVKMAQTIAYRGPDGIRYWVEGNAGFAHLAFTTTPEALYETQPLVSRSGNLVLTTDARIDNRAETIHTLRAKACLGERNPTDADLILAAYAYWGEECPKYLIGDYAFAIWNRQEQRFFGACDALGIRPFIYAMNRASLFFASGVSAVLSGLPEKPALNWEILQDMLVGNFDRWTDQTEYRQIHRLPPSYSIGVVNAQVRLRRYWEIGSQDAIHYKHEQDYYAHYRDLFEQAMRAQLRARDPIAIIGSGGLDSGSIAGSAHHLIGSGKVHIPVTVYAAVFKELTKANEDEYLQILIDYCQRLKFRTIPADDCWAMCALPEGTRYPTDELDVGMIAPAMSLKLLAAARQDGCKVALSGGFGDQVLGQYLYSRLSCIRDISWSRLPGELQYFQQKFPRPIWQLIVFAYLRPFAPDQLVNKFLPLLFQWKYSGSSRPNRRISPAPPVKNLLPPPAFKQRTSGIIYSQIVNGLVTARLYSTNKSQAYIGFEHRFPFLDRRLVDYVLALPAGCLFQQGYTRFIHRQAMQGLMPERIRMRTDKATFGELFRRGLREREKERISGMLQNAAVVKNGLIEAQLMEDVLQSYMDEKLLRAQLPFDILWMLNLEMWMRNLGGRQFDLGITGISPSK